MNAFADSIKLGDIALPNRIVMAPMTRSRAMNAGRPTALTAKYYTQRASAGMIISEATNISPLSCAFENSPGIYTEQQIAGWRQVISSVHSAGGRILCQLWHAGRVGARGILDGNMPLAPSEVNDDLADLQVWGLLANGRYVRINATPARGLTSDEISEVVEQYRIGAKNALAAGFDGIEIHAANGYLPHQFLSPGTNRRSDQYGGSVENRARLLREIIQTTAEFIPLDRIGVRLSPTAAYNSTRDPNPRETYSYVAAMLQDHNIGFIEIADTNAWAGQPDQDNLLAMIRPHFSGKIIFNGGLSPDSAKQLLAAKQVDLVSFGRSYIANPDLVQKLIIGQRLEEPRRIGWYGGTEEGYTDY